MKKTIKYFKLLCTLVLVLLVTVSVSSCRKPKPDPEIPPQIEEIKPTISISLGDENIFLRGTTTLNVTILPTTYNQEYKVDVSDNNLVSYENNQFTGLAEGTVTITVTSKENAELKATATLTVMPDLDNEQYLVSNIVTGLGEDASTSALVKYVAFNKNTSVEYTLASDTEFANAKKVLGSCYYFREYDADLGIDFSQRYIYRTILSDLTPGTDYIYRINNGDNTYSQTYAFKTATGSGDMTFIYLSDTHYWVKADGTSHGSEISEQTISAIKANHPEATFVLDSGDTIDTGGNVAIWDVMFEHRQSFKILAYAAVPGNHEYYINGTGMWDNRFFKSMAPTLLNGPISKNFGSSYFFVYNDVLFLMVDNIKADAYNEQMAWMEEILRNVDYKYSVVNYHIPTHEDNTDHDEKFNALFQKYAVDLVLSGHYHTEDYDFVYDEVDINQGDAGVTFFRGAGSGMKGGDPYAYAISISENGHFSIKRYTTAGALTKTYEFDTIKYKEANPSGDVNVELTYDPETTTGTITWGENAYGKYSKIEVFEELRGEFHQEVFIHSKGYTGITVPHSRDGYDSVYRIELTDKNGNITTLIKEIKTNTGSLSVSPSAQSASLVIGKSTNFIFDILLDHYDIYVNGELVGSTPYTSTSYILNSLNKGTKYTVELRAVDYDDKVAYVLKQEFTTNK